MTENNPVNIASYPTDAEAVMAMSYLEQNGIKSWLAGGVSGKTRVPLGQMLQVAPGDAERAHRLLDPILRRTPARDTGLPPPRWMRRTVTAIFMVIAIWAVVGIVTLLLRICSGKGPF
jgi:hypothetical protein